MRRARGFKEIQPKESIGPDTLNHFGVKSEATNYQDVNGSKGTSDVNGLNKAREQYGPQDGQELPAPQAGQIPEERQVMVDEIFPPMGIPPLRSSHHPSIPCPPVTFKS